MVRDGLSKSRRDEIPRLRRLLDTATTEGGNVLVTPLGPRTKAVFSPEVFEKTLICSKIPLADIPDLNQIATRVVELGNLEGLWSLPLPHYCKYIHPERNPFQPGFGGSLARVRLWQSALLEMYLAWPRLDRPQRMGAFLVNAAFRGGLMSQSSLTALYRQIVLPINLVPANPARAAFVDLELDWSLTGGTERRRWELDAFSELMLVGLQHSPGFNPRKKISASILFAHIHAAFRAIRISKDDLPTSLTDFLDSLAVFRYTQMPAILCAHAAREFVSNALKPHAHSRLYGLRPGQKGGRVPLLRDYNPSEGRLMFDTPEPKRSTVLSMNARVPEDIRDASESLSDWQIQLRAIWSNAQMKRTPQEAMNEVETLKIKYRHLGDHSTLPLALMDWTLFMARSEGSEISLRTASRPTTILHHLSAIDSRLYGYIGDQPLSQFDAISFDDAYEQCFEVTLTAKYRQSLSLSIQKFHKWLRSAGRTSVDLEEISALGGGVDVRQVDANVISEREFEAILSSLSRQMLHLKHPDLPEVAALVTIFGYRCGFRKSEIYKLLLSNVVGDSNEWIHVVFQRDRRLKNDNSVRKVPVQTLLMPNEFVRFEKWVTKRRKAAKSLNLRSEGVYLFAVEGGSEYLPGIRQVFEAIHRAMREATGDSSPHFHLMRHSAGTILTHHLICADSGLEMDPRFGSDNPVFDRQRAIHLRKILLYPALLKPFPESEFVGPTRKIQYLVSQLLGHSHPTVGLEHYVHCLDILFANARRSLDAVFDASVTPQAVTSISPLPVKTTYKFHKKKEELGRLIKQVRKKYPNRYFTVQGERSVEGDVDPMPAPTVASPDNLGSEVQEKPKVSLYISLERLWEALSRIDIQKQSPSSVSTQLGLNLRDLEYAMKAAHELRDLRGKGSQHWMHEVTQPKEYVSICPQLIRKKVEIQAARQLALSLERVGTEFQDGIGQLCEFVVRNSQLTRNFWLFRNATAAAPILKLLAALEGPYPTISVYIPKDVAPKSRKVTLDRWNHELLKHGLGPYKMKLAEKSHAIAGSGVLRVELSPDKSRNISNPEGRLGFRWTLLMLWIRSQALKIEKNEKEKNEAERLKSGR